MTNNNSDYTTSQLLAPDESEQQTLILGQILTPSSFVDDEPDMPNVLLETHIKLIKICDLVLEKIFAD